jgi:hypothetical protein
MYTRRVIISFLRFTGEALIELALFILSRMTGNPYFTSPDPALDVFKDLIDDYQAKYTLALEGGRLARANAKDARAKLREAMHLLGLYVMKVANGNETIMVSSGFPLSKVPETAQRDDFWVIHGPNPGDLLVGCVAYPKAHAYVWQRFTGANPPVDDLLWILAGVTTKSRKGLTGLVSGSREWLRYCAVTTEGMMAWSEPISIIVG